MKKNIVIGGKCDCEMAKEMPRVNTWMTCQHGIIETGAHRSMTMLIMLEGEPLLPTLIRVAHDDDGLINKLNQIVDQYHGENKVHGDKEPTSTEK